MATIGIDLGTTNSLAVTYREGEVELIPNGFGEYLTPSVVHVSDDVLTVGKIAKERLVTDLRIRLNSLNVQWELMKSFTLMEKLFRQRICQLWWLNN